MNQTKFIFFRELIVTQMNYWSVFPLVLSALILSGNMENKGILFLASWIGLSFLPLLFYLVRRWVSGFFWFLLIHAGTVALAFLLPIESLLVRSLYIALGAVFVVYSFYIRLYSDDWEDGNLPPVFSVIFSGVCLSVLQHFGFGQWRRIFSALLILVLCLYFLIFYIEKYIHFLAVNDSSASQIPAEQIFRTGLKLVFVYTLFGGLVLMLTSDITWLGNILNMLKGLLVAVLRIVFAFMGTGESQQAVEETYDPIGGGELADGALYLEDGQSFWLWDLLLYGACIAIAVFALYMILNGLLQIIRYLQSRFMEKTLGSEELSLSEEEDLHERLKTESRKKKTEHRFFAFLSINERMRKLYRKQALCLDADGLKVRRMTARECAQIMQAPAMGNLYEKARYSGRDCTSDDLKKMRAACRKAVVVTGGLGSDGRETGIIR